METYVEIVNAIEKVIRDRIVTMGVISSKQLFESAVELTDDFDAQVTLWVKGLTVKNGGYDQFLGYKTDSIADSYENGMNSDYDGTHALVIEGLNAALSDAVERMDSTTGEREIFGEMFLTRA